MIGNDLLKYNIDNKKFIVFDFESNLNLFFSTPFQLGFLICEGKNIKEEYDFYIKWPDLWVSDEVKKITHYNKERMEKEGKDPKEIFSIFEKYINNSEYYIVGANILGFDTMLLYNCLKRLGLKYNYEFLNRCYDVNALFKAYKLGLKPNYDHFLAWQYSINDFKRRGLKSSVSYVAKEFKISFDEENLHDGLNDCKLTWQNFLQLIYKIDVK